MSIALVPIGEVDKEVTELLKNELKKTFNVEVSLAKTLSCPDYAFNKARGQYLSTAILEDITYKKEYSAYERVLGVFDRDMYASRLNFVFGEAGARAAVISIARLRQSFYGLTEDKKDKKLFQRRVLTEAVHELGHTLGLGHCKDPRCVMYFSNSIADTDRKGPGFCKRCEKGGSAFS